MEYWLLGLYFGIGVLGGFAAAYCSGKDEADRELAAFAVIFIIFFWPMYVTTLPFYCAYKWGKQRVQRSNHDKHG